MLVDLHAFPRLHKDETWNTGPDKILYMLPDFPSLKADVGKLVLARIRHKADSMDPVLSQIKRFTQHEGLEHRYDRVDAPTVQNGPEEIGARFSVQASEVLDLFGEKLGAKIEEIAAELGRQESIMFYRKVHESCEEVGNSIDAMGQPLNGERLLELLSIPQVEFDENGKPKGQFVIHPDMAPTLKRAGEELENDPELKRRYDDVLRRQREDWATRQSNRKLVD